MPLTMIRDLFRLKWVRPRISTREAAKVLSQAAADIRTARERTHDRLKAERAAGMVCGRMAR